MVLNEFSSAITAKEGKAPRSYDEAVGKAKRLAALNSFSLALANKEGRVSTILNTPAGQRNVVASSKKAKKRRKGRRRRRSKKRVE
ncbi:hypothetical protein N7475_002719 [Penicillium sp. IBT 31633x]|nr:hypothetical protein N7475_002719 [Penicillium sp. IBT 31633x]